MNKEQFFQAIKDGKQVKFNGNVIVDSIWTGYETEYYYAQYADNDGVHVCLEGDEGYTDCYNPIQFDDIDDDLFDELLEDFYMCAYC